MLNDYKNVTTGHLNNTISHDYHIWTRVLINENGLRIYSGTISNSAYYIFWDSGRNVTALNAHCNIKYPSSRDFNPKVVQ